MPSDFILFQRDECHLCDLALAVLAEAGAPEPDSRFIDEDLVLQRRYGTRVPVLHRARDGAELDWPFDPAAVRGFVGVNS